MRLLSPPPCPCSPWLRRPPSPRSSLRSSAGGHDRPIVDDKKAEPAAAPAPTGDPVVDRLNALEPLAQSNSRRVTPSSRSRRADQGRLEIGRSSAPAKRRQLRLGSSHADTTGSFTFSPGA